MVGILISFVVLLSAIILLIRLRFFVFSSFAKLISRFVSELKSRQARRSFFLALSGTLGVGNIVGVAVGILAGGAGAVFWLVVSSLFSMVLKYAEASLSSQIIGSDHGIISLIKSTCLNLGAVLSKLYAFLCILLSFFMGAMLQSSSVCTSLFSITGMSAIFIGVLLSFFVVIALVFKTSGIMRIVSWLLPIASVLYLLLCAICILKRLPYLPRVISDIIRCAFCIPSFSGGIIGFIVSSGLKEGFSRGLLSNEAGAGTSTLAHGTNRISSATGVGILGMGEVVVDTVIFCPATALAILVSIGDLSLYSSGVELIMASLGSAFRGADVVLSICIFVFAYATVICWFYYGALSVKYVFGKGVVVFAALYLVSVVLGSFVSDVLAVWVTDVLLLFLTVLTTATLIKRSGRLVELSERAGLLRRL